MARFYDRVVTHGFARPIRGAVPIRAESPPSFAPATVDAIRGVPVIVIDNVAEYFYGFRGRRAWDWRKDFPNVAPPFSSFWMEHRLPRTAILEGGQPVPAEAVGSFDGALFEATDITAPGASMRLRVRMARKGVPVAQAAAVVEAAETARARWVMEVTCVVGARDERYYATPLTKLWMAVMPDGSLLPTGAAAWIDDAAMPSGADAFRSAAAVLFPFFLAHSFLHCRNVELVEGTSPRAERRRYEREHGHPPVRFHTLDILPMRRVLADAGAERSEASGGGLKQALHIARGHFKTFGGNRGKLFGKIEGRFWWPDTVRGTADRVVEKDYRVHAEAPASPHVPAGEQLADGVR